MKPGIVLFAFISASGIRNPVRCGGVYTGGLSRASVFLVQAFPALLDPGPKATGLRVVALGWHENRSLTLHSGSHASPLVRVASCIKYLGFSYAFLQNK